MSVFTLYEAGERIMPGKGGVCSAVCPRHHCPVCEQRGITPKGTRGDRRYMCVGSCDLKWNPNQQYLLVEMYRDEPGIKDRIKKTND